MVCVCGCVYVWCVVVCVCGVVHWLSLCVFILPTCVCVCVCVLLSQVQLFATPWTVAHKAPLSMGLPRPEY